MLAGVFLSDRTCLNAKMIEDGFAKPYDRYICKALPEYQQLNIFAKLNRRDLYERVAKF
jgi:micrococcal nuclease